MLKTIFLLLQEESEMSAMAHSNRWDRKVILLQHMLWFRENTLQTL